MDIPPCFFFSFFVIIKVSRLWLCYNAGGAGLASKPSPGARKSLLEAFGFEALPFVQTMAALLGQAAGEGSIPRSLLAVPPATCSTHIALPASREHPESECRHGSSLLTAA